MRVEVMFAFFPYKGEEHPDIRAWAVKTMFAAKKDPRVGNLFHKDFDDTPITMTRNLAVKEAIRNEVDILVMIDNDMRPDMYLAKSPLAKPFWDSSFDFMLKHSGPCCVAAPYCGPPPHENVYIFRAARKQSDHPNLDFSLDQYGREEAAVRGGIEEVAALPTGLFMLDMRAITGKAIDPPWFDYDYADPPFNTVKATTEDCFFTRNLTLAGVPVYVNWDAWAGHHKRKCVGKPTLLTMEHVRKDFRAALGRDFTCKERLVDIRSDGLENMLFNPPAIPEMRCEGNRFASTASTKP